MICFSSFVVLIIEMELETFKITVLPLRQKMLNFSRRLVEDAADAEDVVQEAFIKLWYIREKSLWHLQNIKNERALHKIQKVGNDMATVLISAFCSALHSNNSSAAKVMRICE